MANKTMRIRRKHGKTAKNNGSNVGGVVGYCVKCRSKHPMKNGKKVMTKKNRWMMKGICPSCGTKMNRFI